MTIWSWMVGNYLLNLYSTPGRRRQIPGTKTLKSEPSRWCSHDGPTIPKPAFLGCRKNVGPSMIEPFLVGCLGKSMKIHTGPIQKWSQKRASMSCIVLPSLGLLLGFLRKSQRLSILVVGIPLESAARFFWDHRNCPKSFHQLMVHAMVPWLSRFG